MPDLTGLPALDVLIGLLFVYVLFSLICSAINEAIASLFAWRAKNLETAIRNMLDDEKGEGGTNLTREFYDDPRIKSLSRRPHKAFTQPGLFKTGRRLPSYIPPRTFALALLDTAAPPRNEGGEERADEGGTKHTAHDLIAHGESLIKRIDNPWIRDNLLTVAADAEQTRDNLRTGVERWFDGVMERAQGWYRRKVHISLAIISVLVAFGANVDSLQIGTKLWQDDAVRAAVVAKAQAAVQQGQSGTGGAATDGATDTTPAQAQQPAPAAPDVTREKLEALGKQVADAKQLELPLGWSADNRPITFKEWMSKLGGLLITALALSLGAPFWFDVLSRVANLRGTGQQIETADAEARTKPHEQSRSEGREEPGRAPPPDTLAQLAELIDALRGRRQEPPPPQSGPPAAPT